MSTGAALQLPAPSFEGVLLAGSTRIDRPLTLKLAGVSGADGQPLLGTAGYVLYRVDAQGEQVWNAATGGWQGVPADGELGTSVPATAMQALGAAGWAATLDASTLMDASGAPLFSVKPPASYFARVVLNTTGKPAQRALSGPSPMLTLVGVTSFTLGPATLPGGGPIRSVALEEPLAIGLAALRMPDGSAVSGDEVTKLGVFVQRASGEVWDEAEQAWRAAPADAQAYAALKPLLLDAKPGATPPWQGELVALGQQDKAGAPRFVPFNEGGQGYRLRAFALIRRAGVLHIGLGALSDELRFTRSMGQERFGPVFDTTGPKDCTDVRLRLRDAAGNPSGWLRLRSDQREVELANFNASGQALASIRLLNSGDIELRPAAGKRVIVAGDMETERIRYLPDGQSVKTLL